MELDALVLFLSFVQWQGGHNLLSQNHLILQYCEIPSSLSLLQAQVCCNLLIPDSSYFKMQQNTLKADLLLDHQVRRISFVYMRRHQHRMLLTALEILWRNQWISSLDSADLDNDLPQDCRFKAVCVSHLTTSIVDLPYRN